MSIQMIWKRLTKNDAALPLAMSLFRLPPFNGKPHIKSAYFCTETVIPALTPPDRGVAREFLINKCGLTDEEITKAFRQCNHMLRANSTQNMEENLELLNDCGLTTPVQIRRVVLYNPRLLFCKSERNLKSKLMLFKTFVNEKDITKFVQNGARAFNASEEKIKSGIFRLQKLGMEGEALSGLLARHPGIVACSEERVMESFKHAEDIGLKKGSKTFAIGLHVLLFMGKENLGRKQQFFSSLGFSEKQFLELLRNMTSVLQFTEEKIKRNVDFLVNTAGLPLIDIIKYPQLIGFSMETRVVPRYRVLKAMESMQVQVLKRRLSFRGILYLTEKRFMEKYVNSNAESSSVLQDIYSGVKDGKPIIVKETSSERVSMK